MFGEGLPTPPTDTRLSRRVFQGLDPSRQPILFLGEKGVKGKKGKKGEC